MASGVGPVTPSLWTPWRRRTSRQLCAAGPAKARTARVAGIPCSGDDKATSAWRFRRTLRRSKGGPLASACQHSAIVLLGVTVSLELHFRPEFVQVSPAPSLEPGAHLAFIGAFAARRAAPALRKPEAQGRQLLTLRPRLRAEGAGGGGPEDIDALLEQAARLRREADEQRQRLRERQAAAEAAPREKLEKEAALVAERMQLVQAKVKRAEAFKLPELDTLRAEAVVLEQSSQELAKKLKDLQGPQLAPEAESKPVEAPAPKEKLFGGRTQSEWEELATKVEQSEFGARFDLGMDVGPEGRRKLAEIMERRQKEREKAEEEARATRIAAAREKARGLRERLTFEAVSAMSNEERLELAKELGPAFVLSLALVGLTYWTVTLPVFAYLYHESVGSWPSVSDLFDVSSAPAAAGLVAGVASIALLLKPVRYVVALLLTPWAAENVLPYLPTFPQPTENEGGSRK